MKCLNITYQLYSSILNEKRDIKYLRGYSSTIFILAKFINKSGSVNRKLDGVLTTEKLFDFQKEEIQKAFGCLIFDQYGCGEISSIAAQCEKGNLYHVMDEHIILETDSNNKINFARITDLDNFALPFIRYENSDIIKSTEKVCECGRNLTCISNIEESTHDFITFNCTVYYFLL